MSVQDILRTKSSPGVISASPSDPVTTAIRKLEENSIGVLPVLDESSRIVGILSERDIVRGLAREGASVLDRRVEQLMSKPIYTCKPTDTIKQVMSWMTNYRIRHLPVVDDGRLLGIVSIGDVVKHRLAEIETETNVLRDTILAR